MEYLELRTILFKEGGIDANVVASSKDSKGNSITHMDMGTTWKWEQLMVQNRAAATQRPGHLARHMETKPVYP